MRVLSSVVVALLVILLIARRKRKTRLPPGPMPIPLLGNLHQHRYGLAPWKHYAQWHQRYGPIISFRLGQQTVISIAQDRVVRDLLERKARLYSSRPRLIIINEWLTNGQLGTFMPNDKKWDARHRLMTAVLGSRAMSGVDAILDRETRALLQALDGRDSNVVFVEFLQNFASSLLYGGDVGLNDKDDDTFQCTNDMIQELLSYTQTRYAIVELFPALEQWLAGTSGFRQLKQDGRKFHRKVLHTFRRKIEHALRQKSRNWAKAIHDDGSADLLDDEMAYLFAELEIGLVGALLIVLQFFADTIAEYPDVMSRAQAEVDAVVGRARLPVMQDQADLPYVNALITELMRYKTAGPVSIPRATTGDDEYMGYHIPRGSLVLMNQWAMNNDAELYESPEIFKPERWIENPSVPPPHAFGAGKRQCPGRGLAQDVMFLTISRLIWAFDTQLSLDPSDIRGKKPQSWLLDRAGELETVFVLRGQAERDTIIINP